MARPAILMVAFHYPPLAGSSGLQRTLSFANYLARDHGWHPVVLSAHPRAYRHRSDAQLGDIDPGVTVVRAPAWDTARHFAIGGRYLERLALPDPWISWWPGAVRAGLKLIRRYRPIAMWSTFPIATAHRIGLSLHKRSALPWIADFRDSMTEEGYPESESQRKMFVDIEQKTVARAALCVFTTPGAQAMYRERYATLPRDRFRVIENGYDEAVFANLEQGHRDRGAPLTFVHSGLLYRSERDPRPFFAAVRSLLEAGDISADSVRFVLRASGDEDYFQEKIDDLGLTSIVELAPSVPYREALSEMQSAAGLLLFQAANCNHQIPAKLYEYFRAQRPILALTHPAGDTAEVVRRSGRGEVVRIDSADDIADGLRRLLAQSNAGSSGPAVPVESYSRRSRTMLLAKLLAGLKSI